MHTLSYALYGYKYWSKIFPPYLVVDYMSHFMYWSKICRGAFLITKSCLCSEYWRIPSFVVKEPWLDLSFRNVRKLISTVTFQIKIKSVEYKIQVNSRQPGACNLRQKIKLNPSYNGTTKSQKWIPGKAGKLQNSDATPQGDPFQRQFHHSHKQQRLESDRWRCQVVSGQSKFKTDI